ncbi:MAG: hypothetical protein RLP44_22620 [Aggregatilineales bacterium]
MSNFFYDTEYSNLIWVTFDGNTWEEYRQLLTDVVQLANESKPIVIAFTPQVDMPKGPPLSHLKWTAGLVKKEDNILHMYVIIDTKHIIGKVFAEVATKLFFYDTPLTVLKDKQALYDAYRDLMYENDQ